MKTSFARLVVAFGVTAAVHAQSAGPVGRFSQGDITFSYPAGMVLGPSGTPDPVTPSVRQFGLTERTRTDNNGIPDVTVLVSAIPKDTSAAGFHESFAKSQAAKFSARHRLRLQNPALRRQAPGQRGVLSTTVYELVGDRGVAGHFSFTTLCCQEGFVVALISVTEDRGAEDAVNTVLDSFRWSGSARALMSPQAALHQQRQETATRADARCQAQGLFGSWVNQPLSLMLRQDGSFFISGGGLGESGRFTISGSTMTLTYTNTLARRRGDVDRWTFDFRGCSLTVRDGTNPPVIWRRLWSG